MTTARQSYWVDHLPTGSSGGGLGKIQFSHVHADETEHSTEVETPSGGWMSTPGEYNPRLKVRCLDCGDELGPDDRIVAR
jgi:hypothetical protein